MDAKAEMTCKICKRNPSIRYDDKRWLTIKCGCRIIIIYPSGIVTEIKREQYVRHSI